MATKLHELGVNVVGVPKTIDNDLNATDYTFGFDTAVNIAMEAIDRLHTTAESHHRALIVEVMGRHAGWIALHAGLAGGANVILIPEQPFSIERVCAYVESRFQSQYAPIVVVAEGATPSGVDLTAVGRVASGSTRSATSGSAASASGWPARSSTAPARKPARPCSATSSAAARPTAFDRVLATRFGLHAIDAVNDRRLGQDGRAARHRHRPGAAGRRDERAQDSASRALRRGRGLLRLATLTG